MFKRPRLPERLIRLEIVIDALITLLVGKELVTHEEIQKQIVKNAVKAEEDDDDVRQS